jgi:hypothetical protein
MIKSKFSLVHNLQLENGEIVVFDATPDECFDVYFTGDKVEYITGIDPDDIYSRLLICWDKDVKELFFIMKTNKIHHIPNGETKIIDYLVNNGRSFLEIDDINTILEFIKL